MACTMARRKFLIISNGLALFDLESDPAEKKNLIKRVAGKRAEIKNAFTELAATGKT